MEIIKNKNILGESPLWNHLNNKLYWVDIEDRKIKCFDDNKVIEHSVIKKPTSLHIKDINTLCCSLEDGVGIYDFRENKFNYLKKIDDKKVRFNDGKCDKNGILYIGTICKKKPREKIANIYKFCNNTFENCIDHISNANGISFNSKNEMFFSDTTEKTIYKKNNDENEIIYTYNYEGPDGSTIDINNNYYTCLFGGSRIDILEGNKIKNSIQLPFISPTCCCFGGENMNKLFITSSFCKINEGNINIINYDKSIGVKSSVIQ